MVKLGIDKIELLFYYRVVDGTSSSVLNIAATLVGTTALGPGYRAVVWVQGCPIHCAGCIAPDWIPFTPNRLVSPAELVAELLVDPLVTGLTFSGGEPMAQAAGLAQVAHLARQRRLAPGRHPARLHPHRR